MAGEANNSDLILRQARQSLNDQRAGGRRVGGSIGRRSGEMKRVHLKCKVARAVAVLVALWVGTIAAGLVLGGIGVTGIILVALLGALMLGGLITFPRLETPSVASLGKSDVRSVVGRTELWLERQRPALPPPAVTLVDQLGVQLDALGLQLDGLDDGQPAAVEVRKLVGETLPGLVSNYTKIPRHLRGEARGGTTPDQQLTESLGKISAEIDSVTRQLASGAIDNLAIQTRYLDYKYGAALDEPAALADHREKAT
ncbi:hypothetical protein ACOYW6_00935 [Parablastomonas sp. CN1-191]|uniref:hypothetical protein n=1 Tax=Parablastomonas sp. CN1-191 TaxID=3400908 RepID=UPI003BF7FB37